MVKSGTEVNRLVSTLMLLWCKQKLPPKRRKLSNTLHHRRGNLHLTFCMNCLLTEVVVCSATRGGSHRMWRAGTTRLGTGHPGMSDTPTGRQEVTSTASVHLLINPFHDRNGINHVQIQRFYHVAGFAVPSTSVLLHNVKINRSAIVNQSNLS
jgi:hypothetical protein